MSHKDVNAIVLRLEQLGWRVVRGRNNHYQFFSPDLSQGPIFHSSTPGDWRANHNVVAKLRRAGAAI